MLRLPSYRAPQPAPRWAGRLSERRTRPLTAGASCRSPAQDGIRDLVGQRVARGGQFPLQDFGVLGKLPLRFADQLLGVLPGRQKLAVMVLRKLPVRLLLRLVDFRTRCPQGGFI